MCNTKSGQDYFKIFNTLFDVDDDDLAFIVGNYFVSVGNGSRIDVLEKVSPRDAEDWEVINEYDRKTSITNSLKLIENTRKKCMSQNIMMDILGKYGAGLLKDMKSRGDVVKIETHNFCVHLSVIHFDQKMNERCVMLKENL